MIGEALQLITQLFLWFRSYNWSISSNNDSSISVLYVVLITLKRLKRTAP